MKAFMLSACLLCTTAQADTLTMPYSGDMGVLACSAPYSEYRVTGTTPSGNSVGLVFEQTRCTVHSGRVASSAFHAGCAQVEWNESGEVVSILVLSTTISRVSVSASTCFNPS